MDSNNFIHKKFYENVHLSVSYDFSKFDGCYHLRMGLPWGHDHIYH
jgi:hypothetical protein